MFRFAVTFGPKSNHADMQLTSVLSWLPISFPGPQFYYTLSAAYGCRGFHSRTSPFRGCKIPLQSVTSLSTRGSEMDKKDLGRYKRVLLERRGEVSVTSAEAESDSCRRGTAGRSHRPSECEKRRSPYRVVGQS